MYSIVDASTTYQDVPKTTVESCLAGLNAIGSSMAKITKDLNDLKLNNTDALIRTLDQHVDDLATDIHMTTSRCCNLAIRNPLGPTIKVLRETNDIPPGLSKISKELTKISEVLSKKTEEVFAKLDGGQIYKSAVKVRLEVEAFSNCMSGLYKNL